MTHCQTNPLPGDSASPHEILRLAGEYRQAAERLQDNCREGEPLSRAPFRFSAIHAIELYLDALLLAAGHAPADLRRMRHDLGQRAAIAAALSPKLRKKTQAHLDEIEVTREYLTMRYDPAKAPGSQLNRLEATLANVGDVATEYVSLHPATISKPGQQCTSCGAALKPGPLSSAAVQPPPRAAAAAPP